VKSSAFRLIDCSPLYWSARGYDWTMRLLYGRGHSRMLSRVSDLIADGSSVSDVCCGTAQLYRQHLRRKGCAYIGLDANPRFVAALRRRGIEARLCDVRSEPIEPADYVTVCSSFYHFYDRRDEVLNRLRAAARIEVIVSEPIENLSSGSFRPLASLASRLSNPGLGEYRKRFDLQTFRGFAEAHRASRFIHEPADKNALAVFSGAASHFVDGR